MNKYEQDFENLWGERHRMALAQQHMLRHIQAKGTKFVAWLRLMVHRALELISEQIWSFFGTFSKDFLAAAQVFSPRLKFYG